MSKANDYRHCRPAQDRVSGICQAVNILIKAGRYQEALVHLRTLVFADEGSGTEMAHGMADKILLEVLRNAGFAEIAQAYQKTKEIVHFWYS